MNREQYLRELRRYLRRLPREEYEDAMDYFTECFDEAGQEGEQGLIRELGMPKEAASEIFGNLLEKEMGKQKSGEKEKESHGVWKGVLIAILAICAAPIGIPLLIVLLALIFSGICIAVAIVLCIFCVVIAIVLVGGKLFLRGIVAIPYSIPGALMLVGVAVLAIGIAIIVVVAMSFLCRWIARGFMWMTGKFLKKGGEKNER